MMNLDPQFNNAPQHIQHIHLMGICGTGMAALAGMLQASGYQVTGSDSHVYPPMSDFLSDLKIIVCNGYQEDNLSPRPDLVIVGNVITRENPEAIALSKTDICYLSFPQTLSHFFIHQRQSLVIAGTHGKTTTCSLLASSLYHADLDPTFMIGGIVSEFGANFRLGQGNYFVAEGDEYDTAFFDKESKFLHYQPKIAVITSIEFDHADIFSDLESIKKAFIKFVKLLPEDGLLIANYDDENVIEIAEYANCEVESYGHNKEKHTWSINSRDTSNGSSIFTIYKDGKDWAPMSVKMTGSHNCMNSLAVCAIMNRLGVLPQNMAKGLATFKGVKRRQEIRGEINGITVIDDFAHHPTAVKETLAALKEGYPGRRLVSIFEPRTNSSRRSIFQEEYTRSFDSADLVLLREPVPIDGLENDELFSSEKLASDLSAKGVDAQAFQTTEGILTELQDVLESGDVVAILSNGGFDNIHERLLEILKRNKQY